MSEESSPYTIFFKTLKLPNLTDTVLLQSESKVFGCGTALVMYEEELEESGLDEFYKKHGDILSDKERVESFFKQNQSQVLWVFRGYEGELMELEEQYNIEAEQEKQLFKEKCFVKFSEEVMSLDSLQIQVSVAYPIEGKAISRLYFLSQKNNKWQIDNMKEEEWTGISFNNAYYP